MVNSSIPNSTLATGRTSTQSSTRSKRSSKRQFFCGGSCQLPVMGRQRLPLQFGHWTLDAGRWTFSSSGRVKGAWWPSRSSKPTSSRLAGRGRFDSYPLRVPHSRHPVSRTGERSRGISWHHLKGRSSGFLDFARNDQDRKEVETCHVSRFAN